MWMQICQQSVNHLYIKINKRQKKMVSDFCKVFIVDIVRVKFLLILMFVLLIISKSFSQEDNNVFKFSGSLSLSDNFYSASGIAQDGSL